MPSPISAPGFCDSHVHVVGDPGRFPLSPARTYLPGLAAIETLEQAAAPLGIDRFVIVQPSFYGTDNSLLLETLGRLGPRGRGVAVIDPARTSDDELAAMAARGVSGLRINLYSGGGGADALAATFDATAARAREHGLHVEVIASIGVLADASEILAVSAAPVVIDHYGLHGHERPDAEAGRRLLRLVSQSHVWMKLSAPYRSGDDPLAIRPDPAWLAAILEVCADRCVWGSDWPHTPAHGDQKGLDSPLAYRPLAYPAVVEGFRDALPDPALWQRILRDNPARLYGFAA